MTSADLAIETQGLGKRFGERTALESIDLRVPRGHAFGFLGPNGAGKTTLIRMLLGLAAPTSGHIRLLGHDLPDGRAAALAHVGAIIEEPRFHPHLTGVENLEVHAAARDRSAAGRIDGALERVGLARRGRDRVGTYSLGMRQRLGIARCLLCDPQLLILDEPVNGLDPEGIRWVRTLARQLADEGRTVFVSSHLMSEMALTADHLVVIGRGTVLADCSTTEFIADHASSYVRVRSPQRGEVAELLRRSGLDVAAQDDELRVQGLDAAAVGELIGRSGLYLHELTLVRSSLEDAFMTLTADSVEYSAHDLAATPAGSTR